MSPGAKRDSTTRFHSLRIGAIWVDECYGDFATTTNLADNLAMTDSDSDPPKTLTEAAEKFKRFLSAQHWPQTISWLTNDNVLVDRHGQFWVRGRGTKAFEQAKLRYSEGVERNLGSISGNPSLQGRALTQIADKVVPFASNFDQHDGWLQA